jgi:hypothetical protein
VPAPTNEKQKGLSERRMAPSTSQRARYHAETVSNPDEAQDHVHRRREISSVRPQTGMAVGAVISPGQAR